MNKDNWELLQHIIVCLKQEQDDKLSPVISNLEKVLEDEMKQRAAIFQIQENERHRISRDLHDSSLQNLTHLIHKIELSSMYIDKDPLQAKLELSVINKNLKSIIEDIRYSIFNLRPMQFDDLGIEAAFESLVNIINHDNTYDVIFDVENVSCENNLVLLTLYRLVQECLNNIVKHANATKIILKGEHKDNKYYIFIEDNGKGFTKEDLEEKKKNHFGISLMNERISIVRGNINFQSEPGKGTKVFIEMPIGEDLIIR